LKAIRPEGWLFNGGTEVDGIWFVAEKFDKPFYMIETGETGKARVREPQYTESDPQTEELAELHAIIQAIEYERGLWAAG
jgi:hypothetical protein